MSDNPKKEKYDILDITKFILSILVVIIHCEPLRPYSKLGNVLTQGGICRIAVPLFFAISGMFLFIDGINKDRLIKQFKKLLIIYFKWSFFYFVVKLFLFWHYGMLNVNFFIEEIWNTIFISEQYHFWYILASIYAIIIILIFERIKLHYCLIAKIGLIIMWIIGCLHYTYNWVASIANTAFDDYICKFEGIFNAIFIALPLIAVGALAYRNYKTLNIKKCIINTIISAVIYFSEIFVLFFCVHDLQHYVHYFSTPFLAYSLLCLLLNVKFSSNKPELMLLFRKTSLLIYCIHPFWIYVWGFFVNDTPSFARFGFVLIASLVFSIICCFVNNLYKRVIGFITKSE